jgi:4-hydroxybenzoate polyprenyltransferase
MTDFFHLFTLFAVGTLIHVFTFVQNNVFDIDVDKQSVYVSTRPLITGSISKKEALFIVAFSFVLSTVIATVFLFTPLSFVFLLLSFLFVTLYNKYSKKIFAMEYVLALGVFTYGLFGAFTVSDTISGLAVIICFFAFTQWLFSVGVFANLKDVKYDIRVGVKTTPTVFGVEAVEDELFIPFLFRVYAFGIKILHIFIAALPFLLGFTSIYVNSLPLPLLFFIILSAAILFLLGKILSTPLAQRDKMLIYEGLQEGLSFLLVPIVLMSYLFEHIGISNTLLMIAIMIAWPLTCFRVIFGKRMIPLE